MITDVSQILLGNENSQKKRTENLMGPPTWRFENPKISGGGGGDRERKNQPEVLQTEVLSWTFVRGVCATEFAFSTPGFGEPDQGFWMSAEIFGQEVPQWLTFRYSEKTHKIYIGRILIWGCSGRFFCLCVFLLLNCAVGHHAIENGCVCLLVFRGF